MAKMGRPQKTLSDKEIAEIFDLASRLTKQQIADYLGISFNTLKEIEKRQPEVSEAIKKGKTHQTHEVVGHLLEQCRKGNITAIIFYLKTQAQWREEQEEVKEIPALQVVVDNDAPNKAAI